MKMFMRVLTFFSAPFFLAAIDVGSSSPSEALAFLLVVVSFCAGVASIMFSIEDKTNATNLKWDEVEPALQRSFYAKTREFAVIMAWLASGCAVYSLARMRFDYGLLVPIAVGAGCWISLALGRMAFGHRFRR